MSAMADSDSHPLLERLQEHWLSNFLLNVAGYGVIVIPAALLIRWLKELPVLKTGGSRVP